MNGLLLRAICSWEFCVLLFLRSRSIESIFRMYSQRVRDFKREKKQSPGGSPWTFSFVVILGLHQSHTNTFIFYALLNNKVDTEELQFEPVFEDVELNEKAFAGELPVTKLSFHAWLYLQEKYLLLDSGAALGRGCGA